MRLKNAFLALSMALAPTGGFAADGDSEIDSVEKPIPAVIYTALANVSAASEIAEIRFHEGTGTYYFQTEAGIDGYITPDAKYVFTSQLMQLGDDGAMFDETRNQAIDSALAMDDSNFITYASTANDRGEVIMVGDVTCEYCRLFHDRIPQVNDAGITLKYMAFPRAGINSEAADAMTAIWCSESPQEALNHSILALGDVSTLHNLEIDPGCDSSAIESGYLKAKGLRLKGTPAYIFEDGTVRTGYMLAEDVVDQALKSRIKVQVSN